MRSSRPRINVRVARHHLGLLRLPISGWRHPLHDEAALRPDRHDDRVLYRLRLRQPEDLGAKVFSPVRIANAAARDRPEPQMHTFHARRVNENLDERARLGQVGRSTRIELEREVRLRRAVDALVVVRAQRCPNQPHERTQHAVFVEARHRVEPALDLRDDCLLGSCRDRRQTLGSRRVSKSALNSRTTSVFARSVDSRYSWLNLLPILPQVLRVRTKNRHLPPRQAGLEHERLKAVDFGVTLPCSHERVVESLVQCGRQRAGRHRSGAATRSHTPSRGFRHPRDPIS